MKPRRPFSVVDRHGHKRYNCIETAVILGGNQIIKSTLSLDTETAIARAFYQPGPVKRLRAHLRWLSEHTEDQYDT